MVFEPAEPELSVLRAPFNNAHRALALLNLPSVLSRIAPCTAAPPLITQNIDGLSLRILSSVPDLPLDAKDRLFQMHGELFRTTCLDCKASKFDMASPLCPALKDSFTIFKDGQQPIDIPVAQLPRCGGPEAKGNRYGRCGGLLRPAVVWFGEIPLQMGDIGRFISSCDLLLVVGTSSVVRPFAITLKRAHLHVEPKNDAGLPRSRVREPSPVQRRPGRSFQPRPLLGRPRRRLPLPRSVRRDVTSGAGHRATSPRVGAGASTAGRAVIARRERSG